MSKILCAALAAITALSIQANTITNFQKVELFSFDCGPARANRAQKIVGAEWNKDEAIVRLFKANTSGDEEILEFEARKTFGGRTLYILGKPIDGSEGNLQFMLRDGSASTVIVNSRGVSYLKCDIETL